MEDEESINEGPKSVTMDTAGQVLLVAEGGKGGMGNFSLAGNGTRRQMSLVNIMEYHQFSAVIFYTFLLL